MWKLKANLFGKMEGHKGNELLKSHSYKVVKMLQNNKHLWCVVVDLGITSDGHPENQMP